jgi:SAM-dependent methyltransferase
MSPPQPVPRRFRSTVPYYARFRPGYPETLIARVSAETGLVRGDGVLDLGCGPGLLSIPFAQAGMRVVGVDPEADMLAAARELAKERSVAVEFRPGDSAHLPDGLGPVRLVTMGRSFHWMERAETLSTLDSLLLPGGAIVLFDDEFPRTAENGWRRALEGVGKAYGFEDAPHRAERRKPDYRTHESLLLESAFCDLVKIGVFVQRLLAIDDMIGYALSLSVSSPEALGARADAFERDLRAALEPVAIDGSITQLVEFSALIAKRAC